MTEAFNDGKTRVLEATDIVQLIGQSVKLIRRGKDYVGLCPFHQEKTPSFHVKPDRQFFYCFGCKASGDALSFVMKRDRIEFREALELLAREANVDLPRFGGGNRQPAGERQALLDAHSSACAVFEKWLAHEQAGQAAREYLASRGFDPAWLKKFQVGYAPEGWDHLLGAPEMRKFPPALLAKAGLVKTRETGGQYDTFRHRIMFPIRDESGRVIAFGGRVMPGSDDPAKYLNSPETPLFSKGRSVYGIDLARQRIIETRTVAIVEGYTDVIMAHQHGASNVVSILGTAMTEGHVALLRRFADRIVLLFDADEAGETAANRAMELFLSQPIEIAIASMPEGIDPDEFLINHGAEGFAAMIDKAQDALTYKWKQLSREFSAAEGDLTRQQKVVSNYLDLLASARGSGPVDSLRWGQVLARVSRMTGVPVNELQRRFKQSRPASRTFAGRGPSQSVQTVQAGDESQPTVAVGPLTTAKKRLSAGDRAQRWILGVLLTRPGTWHDVQKRVSPDDFSDEACSVLAKSYWDHQRDEGEPVWNEFHGSLPTDGLKSLAVELVEEMERLTDIEQTLETCVKYLEQRHLLARQSQAVAALRSDEPLSESRQIDELRNVQALASRPDLRRSGR